MAKLDAEKAEAAASGSGAVDTSKGVTSVFHGKADKDYQGVDGRSLRQRAFHQVAAHVQPLLAQPLSPFLPRLPPLTHFPDPHLPHRPIVAGGPQGQAVRERALLPAQALGAHLDRPHQGRQRDPFLPQHRAPAAVRGPRWQGQDLGCVRLQQVHAHIPRALQGGCNSLLMWDGRGGGGPWGIQAGWPTIYMWQGPGGYLIHSKVGGTPYTVDVGWSRGWGTAMLPPACRWGSNMMDGSRGGSRGVPRPLQGGWVVFSSM